MLFNIKRRQLITKGDESIIVGLWADLAKAGFNGAVFQARQVIAQNLGIDTGSKKNLALFKPRIGSHGFIDGDLFEVSDKGMLYLIAAAVAPRDDSGDITEDAVFKEPSFDDVADYSIMLEAGRILIFGEEPEDDLDNLCAAIEKSLKGPKFQEFMSPKPAGMDGLGASDVSSPTEEDLEVANVLRDPKVQDTIAQLEGTRAGIVVDDYLANQANAEEMEYYIDKLLEAGLILEELAVFCKKTNQPTIRVKSRGALDQLAEAGVKCSCGEPLTAEDAKRLILVDAARAGKHDPAWVFRVFLTNYLLKIGVPQEHILERAPGGGGDPCLLVAFDGQLLAFHLSSDSLTAAKVQKLLADLSGFGSFSLISMVAGNIEPGLDAILANAGNCDQFVVLRSVDELNVKLVEVFERIRTGTISGLLSPMAGVRLANIDEAAMRRLGLGRA